MTVRDDSEESGHVWPHRRPPGQWRLTATGAHHWLRAGVDDWYELPIGRGPGHFDRQTTRWWPEDFKFDPFGTEDPPRTLSPLSAIQSSMRGWQAFVIGSTLHVLEDHPIAMLPNGASRFARGGWPERTAALNHRTGEVSWWDPAERQWQPLGTFASDPLAQLFGCEDGIGLLASGRLIWFMADHTSSWVMAPSGDLGHPLAPPVYLDSAILWPASTADGLKLWALALPKRTSDLADPQRYVAAQPIAVAIEGRAPEHTHPSQLGMGVSLTASLAWFPARDGALEIRRSPDAIFTARWHPHPDGYHAFPDLPLHVSGGTGQLEAQLESGEHVAVMALGTPQSLRSEPGGLSATLGGQKWQGRRAIGRGAASAAIVGDAGRWLLPIAELDNGSLMLEFSDVTQRDAVLRGAAQLPQRAQLLTVAGGMPHPLNATFQLQSVQDIAVIAHEDGLLVTNREDSRECVALGRH